MAGKTLIGDHMETLHTGDSVVLINGTFKIFECTEKNRIECKDYFRYKFYHCIQRKENVYTYSFHRKLAENTRCLDHKASDEKHKLIADYLSMKREEIAEKRDKIMQVKDISSLDESLKNRGAVFKVTHTSEEQEVKLMITKYISRKININQII